jgi:hypothetical protein
VCTTVEHRRQGNETCEPHFAYTDALHLQGKADHYRVLLARAMIHTITVDTFEASPLYAEGLHKRLAGLRALQTDLTRTLVDLAEAAEAQR